MIIKRYRILVMSGIHARSSAEFTRTVQDFESNIFIRNFSADHIVDAKGIIDLITIALTYRTEFEIVIDGPDENEVLDALNKLFDESEYWKVENL